MSFAVCFVERIAFLLILALNLTVIKTETGITMKQMRVN
tara:strand:+ start:525 stop:641 length:117 start_codon:yes stop_codon:yes gene_type:complete